MSGFAGIVGPGCTPDGLEWIEDATAHMRFRGPDALGTWHDARAALGHALLRVSTRDAWTRQPLTLDGNAWIVADVRLDAREQLLDKLYGLGRQPSANAPDAELVLHAYHVWGDRCLEQITGDFSFAIWEPGRAHLLCARDQLGVVPLYYTTLGEELLVSNTLESLLLHPEVPDALDDHAIADFLLIGMNMDTAATSFAAIHRVPPAHSLSWTNGKIVLRKYWSLPDEIPLLRLSRPSEYVEQFRDLFSRAVSDRIDTDHLSMQLSGGLDSTSIAATCRKLQAASGSTCDTRAVTVLLGALESDPEGPLAQAVATSLSVPLDVRSAADYPDRDPFQRGNHLTPEPWPYLSSELEYDVVRRAASHGRVMLTGLGGDPLLTMPPWYWMTWLGTGKAGRLAAASWHHIRQFHSLPKLSVRTAMRSRAYRRRSRAPIPAWLSPSLTGQVNILTRHQQLTDSFQLYEDARGMVAAPFWSALLPAADPDMTGLALRCRHPFFDLRLIQFALSIPPTPWLNQKAILRDAMTGVLPDSILRRPKTPLTRAVSRDSARRALDRRAISLVASTPGLEQFLDREELIVRLQSIDTADFMLASSLRNAVGLAYWLQHWRRPGSGTRSQVVRPRRGSRATAVPEFHSQTTGG